MPTALVTGASSGIGRATAALLVERGYRVIGTCRNPESLSAEARAPGVTYRALDLADPKAVEEFAGSVSGIDVLVNNAGESQSGPLEELPDEAIRRLFQVNVFAPVRLAQLLLPDMRKRGRGRIVMVGSMLASFPLAYRSSYVATKAALAGFSHAARRELAPRGVWISTVEPGWTHTGITARRTSYLNEDSPYRTDFNTMLGHLNHHESTGIPPERVAETILLAITDKKPKQLYAIGSRAPLIFLAKRLLPAEIMARLVARKHGLRR